MKTYCILGANGNIAKEVSKHLEGEETKIIQFSRKPIKTNPTDELISGDLLNLDDVKKATSGCDVVFLLAGLEYSSSVWEEQWPKIMANTIEACEESGSKLVFFDNMYAVDPAHVGNITEDSPLGAPGRKGIVRQSILEMLWQAVEENRITALVARAADFYGPDAMNSIPNEMILSKMISGKSPQWLYSGDRKHSFTYIPDAGHATAFLAQQDDSWNQTWNLPTGIEFPSANDIVAEVNQLLGTNKKLSVLPAFGVSLMGVFMPILKEMKENRYQLDQDYCFHSNKIAEKYNLHPTPLVKGLKKCLKLSE